MMRDDPRRQPASTTAKTEAARNAREDEEMYRTGTIQSERQVFELAREFFGLDSEEGAA